MATVTPAVVLVVDDDQEILRCYADWLQPEYTVRTANDGQEALELIGKQTDIVLLVRRMPDLSRDLVLQHLQTRCNEVMVAMISPLEPDADIVELPFDEHIHESTNREEIEATVESLLERAHYNQHRQRCYRLASKIAAFEETFSRSALESNGPY